MAKRKVFEKEGNYTRIDNLVLEEIIPDISAVAVRVLLVILRQTRGWQKYDDDISYSTLMKKSKIKSPHSIRKAISELAEKNIVICTKFDDNKTPSNYELNFGLELEETEHQGGKECSTQGGTECSTRGANNAVPGGQIVPPSYNSTKETIKETIKEKHIPEPQTKISKSWSAISHKIEAQKLADICGIDSQWGLPKQLWDIVQNFDALTAMGMNEQTLSGYSTWWHEYDWRGQKGNLPTPMQVRETWKQYEKHLESGSPHAKGKLSARHQHDKDVVERFIAGRAAGGG